MRFVLKKICKNKYKLVVESDDKEVLFALHECLQRDFLENLDEWKDGYGDYHFDKMGEIRVSAKGLTFLEETSSIHMILQGLFKVFRGLLGYVLGIVSGLIIAYITWKLRWLN